MATRITEYDLMLAKIIYESYTVSGLFSHVKELIKRPSKVVLEKFIKRGNEVIRGINMILENTDKRLLDILGSVNFKKFKEMIKKEENNFFSRQMTTEAFKKAVINIFKKTKEFYEYIQSDLSQRYREEYVDYEIDEEEKERIKRGEIKSSVYKNNLNRALFLSATCSILFLFLAYLSGFVALYAFPWINPIQSRNFVLLISYVILFPLLEEYYRLKAIKSGVGWHFLFIRILLANVATFFSRLGFGVPILVTTIGFIIRSFAEYLSTESQRKLNEKGLKKTAFLIASAINAIAGAMEYFLIKSFI